MNNANAAVTVPAESSNFSYEPPKSEATPQELAEFNDLLGDSIKEISEEYAPQRDLEDEQPTEEAQDTATEPAQEQAPTEDSPEVARGMERLVQREVALQAKEADYAQRANELASLRAENTKLKAAAPQAELLKKFDTSPSDALKAMGKDPATVVRLMIAEQLHSRGEPVPEGLKQFVEKAAQQREIDELKSMIASRDEAAKQAQVFSAVQHGAREYVKTIDGKKMPSYVVLSKSDPDLAHEILMEEVDRMAAKDPNTALTFDAAAGAAEKRLARIVKAMGPQNSTQPTTQAQGAKTSPPATKAPVRPLRPWEQRNTSLDDAIKDATREFYQEEAKQRANKR